MVVRFGIFVAVVIALVACRGNSPSSAVESPAPVGTMGRGATQPVVVDGCVSLGEMGTLMLTDDHGQPAQHGLGRGAAVTGYRLTGSMADMTQYVGRRVRVTALPGTDGPPDMNASPTRSSSRATEATPGAVSEHQQSEASRLPASKADTEPRWRTLNVQSIERIGDCRR